MFSPSHRANSRGYTLTEMIIVMGIMGSVLGTIWVTSAIVKENNKARKAAEQVTAISQNYKQFFKNGPSGVAAWTDITADGVTSDAFPGDMLVGGQPQNPWGGAVNVLDRSALPLSGFAISYEGLSQRTCNLLANTLINPSVQPWVAVGPVAGPVAFQSPSAPSPIGGAFPLGFTSWATWAQTNCGNNNMNVVRVMFPIQ
jgi:prepilin-type N-terminal cleavage/methylation domain-containing protein